MVKICSIGAGSLEWAHTAITDILSVFDEPVEMRLHDLDLRRAGMIARFGERATEARGRKDRYLVVPDRREALKDADGVVITVAVGGLDAMEADLSIPEKYGVFATVGDTTGPGGWSRSIRNIPAFQSFARDIAEVAPRAFVVNFTNPMASLTSTLQQECPNPCVGLCHAYFETLDVIQRIFSLPDHSGISAMIAGMNHFTWALRFQIGQDDGYRKLGRLLAGRSLGDILFREFDDGIHMPWSLRLFVDLFETYGYLTLPGDRHTCEFLPYVINGAPVPDKDGRPTTANLEFYRIQRTLVTDRRRFAEPKLARYDGWNSGRVAVPMERSRETAADIIQAYLHNRPFTTSVNSLNVGQIRGLPTGVCVETPGTIDGQGVRPHVVDRFPDSLLALTLPHALAQRWITEGARSGNREMLLEALLHDPSCSHLRPSEIRKMAEELLDANRPYVHERLGA